MTREPQPEHGQADDVLVLPADPDAPVPYTLADAPYAPPLDVAVQVAREMLAEAEAVNILDHRAVVGSHASLKVSLRNLLAALDTEGAAR